MHSIVAARRAGLLLILGIGVAAGQSTLSTIKTAAPKAGHRAQVVYSQGKLEIAADDSSLNEILRDISRETGMKITGGISDERVYGRYGPSSPAEVLTNLLNGTASNMILMQTASHAPAELILTPRRGGATPPNPNAPGFDNAGQSNESPYAPGWTQEAPAVQPAVAPMSEPGVTSTGRPPTGNVNTAPGTPLTTIGGNGATDTRSDDTSNPPSANVVKTPQEIYQQLRLLQQQQQANPK